MAAISAVICPACLYADTFGAGDHAFTIEFVTIGDPGNPPDKVIPWPTSAPLPSGTVDYVYRMTKYEIPEEVITKVNALSSISGDGLELMVDVERGPQKPATGLSWFDQARFVNWLNEENGAPPAYKFDATGAFQLWAPGDPGYDPDNKFRNTRARYFLPTADEWHKAAYYDPTAGVWWDYPHGSDDPPIPVSSGIDPGTAVFNQQDPADVTLADGESPFGVVGLAGNAHEREETSATLINDLTTHRRGGRGGWWVDLTLPNYSLVISLFVTSSGTLRGIWYPSCEYS